MAGFSNETMYANNVNFSGAKTPAVTADGQLLIGSTASPNIRVGTLSSVDGSLTISNGSGTISLSVAGGTTVGKTITGDSGGSLPPLGGNWNLLGSGSITTSGAGSTLTFQLQNLTNHAVLVGAGTSTITNLAVGTTGQLLVGATGADPAFGSSANADFTFGGANSGATRTFSVTNTSNTASSAANVQVTVGGGTAADTQTTYTVTGVTNWSQGIDNSDSDAYVLAASTALGTTNVIHATTAGIINYPLQPAFLAYPTSTVNNATGDGTVVSPVSLGTEIFDQGSNFASDTFTAPVTGRYFLNFVLGRVGVGTSTVTSFQIVTSNRAYLYNSAMNSGTSGDLGVTFGVVADMDAADTATVSLTVSGGAKNIGYFGGGTVGSCFFGGYLIA